MRTLLVSATLSVAVAGTTLGAIGALAAQAPPAWAATDPGVVASVAPGSYTDPPFDCRFHRYDEGEPPSLSELRRDPLCVQYAKRDVTVTNGGAVDFLAAEPTRVAVALPACRYWQRDHWSVQVAPGDDALVSWDGSYWFDKGRLSAAAAMYRFRVAGQPVSAARAAATVRPVSPALASAIERYGVPGGTGMRLDLPGSVHCPHPGS